MIKKRFLSMLVLLAAVVTGAVAQEVTLLTTIESTGDNASFTSGSKTFDNIATVTFSGNVENDGDHWGWYSDEECTLTVTAAEGYTITRVKFYTRTGSAFDEEAPFEAILLCDDECGYIAKVNGTSIGEFGVTKIEVYGYAGTPEPAPVASTYTVTLKEGTEDADNWTITPAEATTTGMAQGTEVTATYSGTKKVKSVKAVKKAAAGPVTYTELNGGEVLHVGDIINLSEEISFNGGDFYMGSYGSPYTVLRADLTIDELDMIVVNEKADGNYYVIKSNDGYYYDFQRALGVTSTSDGILVTYNGISWGYKGYTFTVHEP